jgi:alpha-L-rhamnosidase
MNTLNISSIPNTKTFIYGVLCMLLVGFGVSASGIGVLQASTKDAQFSLMWNSSGHIPADVYTAFRGGFTLDAETEIEMLVSGSSWYVIWLNGEYFFEGPDRYHPNHPEYQVRTFSLPAGDHILAVQVHYEGIDTRIMKDIQPFLMLQLHTGGNHQIPVNWRCVALPGYDSRFLRISAQLGWIEWVDTRLLPIDWQQPGFDDGSWKSPVLVERNIGNFTASKISNVISTVVQPG